MSSRRDQIVELARAGVEYDVIAEKVGLKNAERVASEVSLARALGIDVPFRTKSATRKDHYVNAKEARNERQREQRATVKKIREIKAPWPDVVALQSALAVVPPRPLPSLVLSRKVWMELYRRARPDGARASIADNGDTYVDVRMKFQKGD